MTPEEAPRTRWTRGAMVARLRDACEEAGLAFDGDALAALDEGALFGRFFEDRGWRPATKYEPARDVYGVDAAALAEAFPPMAAEELEARRQAEEARLAAEDEALARRMEREAPLARARAAEREAWAQERGYYPDSVGAVALAAPDCARAWRSLSGEPTLAVRTGLRGWLSCPLADAWERDARVDARSPGLRGSLLPAEGQPPRPHAAAAGPVGRMRPVDAGFPRGPEPGQARWEGALAQAAAADAAVAALCRAAGWEPPAQGPAPAPARGEGALAGWVRGAASLYLAQADAGPQGASAVRAFADWLTSCPDAPEPPGGLALAEEQGRYTPVYLDALSVLEVMGVEAPPGADPARALDAALAALAPAGGPAVGARDVLEAWADAASLQDGVVEAVEAQLPAALSRLGVSAGALGSALEGIGRAEGPAVQEGDAESAAPTRGAWRA